MKQGGSGFDKKPSRRAAKAAEKRKAEPPGRAAAEAKMEDATAPQQAVASVESPADMEELRRRVTMDAAPGGRQDALLRSMGVKGIEDTPAYVPGSVKPVPGKEITVTVFDVIPMGVQNVVEKGLIAGFAASLLFFLACGIGIGLEAFAVASKSPLPPEQDAIVLKYLEPAFTPSLLVVFFFSITLGVLKSGQMGRAGSLYREED